MKKSPIQQLKLAITSTLIALLCVVTGLAFVYKTNQSQLNDKDLKISMLVQEIGEVKGQNEQLYQYFQSEKQNLNGAVQNVEQIHQKLDTVGMGMAKMETITQLQDELKSANSNLLSLIEKKDQTIKDLNNKNKMIAQAAAVKQNPDSLNILILGQHQGLTDTIMLASANAKTKKITLVSIPRDLYYNGRKINEYYERYGTGEISRAVGEVTGIQPDKYIVIDMQSFVDIIDALGGIDITVPKAIVDAEYPGANNTYTKVSFASGLQHMDGSRALRYARSRKSTSDFDRSDRQQLIIQVVKQRAEELDLKDNIALMSQIYNDVKDNIKTDINLIDAMNYYNNYHEFGLQTGNTLSTENYLYSKISSIGQYILLPNKGDFSQIQNYIAGLIGN